jgi:hypothetical protein
LPVVGDDDAARKRELVRRGYDAISHAYRHDDGTANPSSDEDPGRYLAWVDELAALLPRPGRVLDLGCGAGVPAAKALYSLIHVPLPEQRALLPRIRSWLAEGGFLLAIVGAAWWTGTESYLGTDMFWDHADTGAYLRWFREAGLVPRWHRYIPEGNTGHSLILAAAE